MKYALALLALLSAHTQAAPRSSAEVLAQSPAADWRSPEPENLLVMDLTSGTVIIELAPSFAPAHVANLRTLARQHYFDGLKILRVQDNYVTQWGDPAEAEAERRPLGEAKPSLAPEFSRPLTGLPFLKLRDGDVYAPEVGHSGGFPLARDPKLGRAWLTHCYGMVGAGRGDTADSGNASELYVVIGHAPRHLDRNVTLLGRVLRGMEHLSALPRGTGALGFYEKPEQHTPLTRVRLASELPEAERPQLEVLRTESDSFRDFVAARRTRREDWFIEKTGRIELCNVAIPVRVKP